MGNYNCLATIVDFLIKPFGYDEVILLENMEKYSKIITYLG